MTKNLLVLGTIVLAVVGAIVWSRSAEDPPLVEDGEAWPMGRWHFRPRTEMLQDQTELARTLSLPYTGTGAEATGDAGVLVHDVDRASAGVNLYTSGHAPEALLIDMSGNLVHRWRLPFEKAFPERPPSVETAFFRRAALLPDGGLLAMFQGVGLVRLDRDSNLVWALDGGFFNDLHVAADGSIYSISKDATIEPRIHAENTVLADSIVEIDGNGRLVRRVSLLETFLDSPFSDLLEPITVEGDIFHTNTVDLIEGARGEWAPGFPAGTVLTSLREVDIVALIDLDRPAVLWAQRGRWDAQHQPELLETGRILLFDNKGGPSGSRVLELDPETDEIAWQYPGAEDPPFSSPEAGSAQRLPNGNTLVTVSEKGRALEIDPAGEIVWEFVSPHRGGARNELVATLFEVLRLPSRAAEFLEPTDPG